MGLLLRLLDLLAGLLLERLLEDRFLLPRLLMPGAVAVEERIAGDASLGTFCMMYGSWQGAVKVHTMLNSQTEGFEEGYQRATLHMAWYTPARTDACSLGNTPDFSLTEIKLPAH